MICGKQCLWVPIHVSLVGGSIPQAPVDRMINHAAAHLAALYSRASVLLFSCNKTKEKSEECRSSNGIPRSLFFSVNAPASVGKKILAWVLHHIPAVDPHWLWPSEADAFLFAASDTLHSPFSFPQEFPHTRSAVF